MNILKYKFENNKLRIIKDNYEKLWFVGYDVAKILGYKAPRNCLSRHVDFEDKKKVSEITTAPFQCSLKKNKIMINESGVYSLIFSSKLEEAKIFKRWLTVDLLPSIRKYGYYKIEKNEINNIKKLNIEKEYDLHKEIVNTIKKYYDFIIIPGLGENQINKEMRINSYIKGYEAGQPDLILLYNDLKIALELKTPAGNGIVSISQLRYLEKLKKNNFHIIISNDYTDIIMKLNTLYMNYKYDIRYKTSDNKKSYKTLKGLNKYEDSLKNAL